MPLFRRRGAPSAEDIAKALKAELDKAAPAPAQTFTYEQQMAQAQAAALQLGQYQALPRTAAYTVPFGPGVPILPSGINPSPTGRPDPRQAQYPVSINVQVNPIRDVPHDLLRQIATSGIVRRCIEIRKAEIVSLDWDITVKDTVVQQVMADTGEKNRARAAANARTKYDTQIVALRKFWTTPDRKNGLSWTDWMTMLLEDVLVLDAPSVYPHQTLGGAIVPGISTATHSFVVIDGSTIKPLLDDLGGVPQPPDPAYQQILYGVPRSEFLLPDPDGNPGQELADVLFYRPRNRRDFSPYGLSPVEQCLPDIDLYLKRIEWLRAEYGDGATPNTWLKPLAGTSSEDWTPDQRRNWERHINADLMGNSQARHELRVLPPGWEPHAMGEFGEKYKAEFDEHLMKTVGAYFDIMPTQLGIVPRSGLGGKGHQDGETEKADEQAKMPLQNWLVDLLNDLSVSCLGMSPDLTFVLRSGKIDDILDQVKARDVELRSGQRTLNQILGDAGLPLQDFAEADEPWVHTGTSIVFLRGAMQAQQDAQQAQIDHLTQPTVAPQPPNGDDDQGDPVDGQALNDDGSDSSKAAELAAYRRFVKKPHAREFVWKVHSPDEVKAIEADVGKARPRLLPGHRFLNRLTAFYAPKIQEALRSAIDPVALATLFLGQAQLKAALRREDAEAAALFIAQHPPHLQELRAILGDAYTDAYLAGLRTGWTSLPASLTADGVDFTAAIDWSNWEPGNPALAASLLDPTSDLSLQSLLEQADIVIQGITDSTGDRLANALAQGIADGLSADETAALLSDIVDDPNRAYMIADTEMARAMTAGSLDTYQANGVRKWNLLTTSGACTICLDAEASNPHGYSDDAPPYHPLCRCAVSPVVDTGGEG